MALWTVGAIGGDALNWVRRHPHAPAMRCGICEPDLARSYFDSDHIISCLWRVIKAQYIRREMNRVRYGYAAAAWIMDYYEYNERRLALLYPPQALLVILILWVRCGHGLKVGVAFGRG